MPDIQSIRVLHQRGDSERAIAGILRINRRTVRRYLAEEVIESKRRMHLKERRPSPKIAGHAVTSHYGVADSEHRRPA